MPTLDWSDLQHFLAVQRTGSLAGAARMLKVDATTVGRRVAALEKAIGARLLERGGTPTEAGRRIVASVEAMDAASHEALRKVAAAGSTVTGVVRVAATEAMAANHLLPHAARFQTRHPDLELELVTGNPSVSLSRRDADLAVRLLRPSQPGLFAKKAGAIAIAPYAAKRYLQRHGAPADDWSRHRVIAYTAEAHAWPEAQWLAKHAAAARTALRVNSVLCVAAAVRAGLGIGLLPCGIGDRESGVERVAPPSRGLEREIWLVVHQDLRNTPRVRAAWDFLLELLELEGPSMRGAGS